MYSSILFLLSRVTPCLPRSRLKSHLGEAAEEHSNAKIIYNLPDMKNFVAVGVFSRFRETRDKTTRCRQL